MNITMKVIPHNEHRYETVGDWWFDEDGSLQIRVSDMGNEDYAILVAVHELIEVLLCKKRGITDEAVSAFDTAFEDARVEGNTDEPGDDPKSPYRAEHLFATGIEKLLAAELGVDWKTYDEAVNAL
jgi:hypothetical protein